MKYGGKRHIKETLNNEICLNQVLVQKQEKASLSEAKASQKPCALPGMLSFGQRSASMPRARTTSGESGQLMRLGALTVRKKNAIASAHVMEMRK